MFTSCPACSRQFRIRASQLATAEGLVQCGFCGKQFNALERLYDKPLPAEALSPQAVPGESNEEPDFYIPELPGAEDSPDEPQAAEEVEKDEIQIELPEPEPASKQDTEPGFTFEIADEAVIAPPRANPGEGINMETGKSESAADYPFPEELSNEEEAPSSRMSKLFWSSGVLFLLLCAIAQAAWFQRDLLLSRYPELLPYARQLCEQLDCTLIRNRNISAIKLLNRDVRVHPRYEDALLVNATITNLSTYTQRFPTIMLSLFDNNGDVIAYRQIPPADYLDSSIDEETGMAFDSPIHVVFEVANTATEAVSFEFDFL